MDKFKIREEIATLINTIKKHSDAIGNREFIPQAEVESILIMIDKLYKKAIVFDYLNSLPDSAQIKHIADIVRPHEEKETNVDLPDNKQLSSPTENHETQKRVEKKEEKSTIDKIKSSPISDIRTAIGINEKFQFINELFGGKVHEYETAILEFNILETKEDATLYFLNLQQSYRWKEDSETVKRLLHLINRRYS